MTVASNHGPMDSEEPPYHKFLDKMNLDLGVGYTGIRTTFSHKLTPLVLYSVFLDQDQDQDSLLVKRQSLTRTCD